MLQELPMESVCEITHRFGKKFRGGVRAAWTILRLVFLEKLDAKLEWGIRGFLGSALMSIPILAQAQGSCRVAPFVLVCVLCPDRESGDLPLCVVVCGIDRSSFVDFLR